jgi:hypothetical protein
MFHFSRVFLRSAKLTANGLQLGEVADFEALSSFLALNFF